MWSTEWNVCDGKIQFLGASTDLVMCLSYHLCVTQYAVIGNMIALLLVKPGIMNGALMIRIFMLNQVDGD